MLNEQANLRQEIEKQKKQMKIKETEIQGLKEKCAIEHKDMIQTNRDLDLIAAENDRLKKELSDAHRIRNQVFDYGSKTEKENLDLRMEIKRLNKLWQQSKRTVDKLQNTKDFNELENNRLKTEVKTLESSISDINDIVVEKKHNVDVLKSSLGLTSQLNNSRKEIITAQDSLNQQLWDRFQVWERKVFLNVGYYFKQKRWVVLPHSWNQNLLQNNPLNFL